MWTRNEVQNNLALSGYQIGRPDETTGKTGHLLRPEGRAPPTAALSSNPLRGLFFATSGRKRWQCPPHSTARNVDSTILLTLFARRFRLDSMSLEAGDFGFSTPSPGLSVAGPYKSHFDT